jgi:hypothetical protein
MSPSSDPNCAKSKTRSYDFAHWIAFCREHPKARSWQMQDIEFVESLAGQQVSDAPELLRALAARETLVRPETIRALEKTGTETISADPQVHFLNRRVTGLTLAALAGIYPPENREDLVDPTGNPGLFESALLGGALDASRIPVESLLAGENPYTVPILSALAHDPGMPRKFIRVAIQPRNASNLGGISAVGTLANLPFLESLLDRPAAMVTRATPLTVTSDEFPLQGTTAAEYVLYLASCLRESCVPFLEAVVRHPASWSVPVSWREEWEAGNDEEDLKLPFGLAAVMATSVSTFLSKFPGGPGGEEWQKAVRTLVRGSLEQWPGAAETVQAIAREPRLAGALRDVRLSPDTLMAIVTGIQCRRGLELNSGEWPAEPIL